MKIEFIEIETIKYEDSLKLMDKIIDKAKKSKKNFLIFCTHPSVYTIGSDKVDYENIKVVKSDRGGSITYHDEGCLMVYFIFHIASPPLFYKKVLNVFHNFFKKFSTKIYYDKKRPGFYIENRKIASLGFRYKNGISKHGVSIHINPDLKKFNLIKPCNLEGVIATSFEKENIDLKIKNAKKILKELIYEEFCKTKS